MSPKAQPKPKMDEPQIVNRAFLRDEALRNGLHAGKNGFFVKVCLTSYRSLPLSCIDKIELSVDGETVDPRKITFILNGYAHKLDELAALSRVSWFILDTADLFVESPKPLSAGLHDVAARMVTVEPYVSRGVKFHYPSQKQLSVLADDPEVKPW